MPTEVFDYLDWQQDQRRQRRSGADGGAVAGLSRGGAGDDEPADRRGARAVRVRGARRCAWRQPGARGASLERGTGAAWAARASGSGPAARQWAAGPGASTAAGDRWTPAEVAGFVADLETAPGPGDRTGDVARWAARRRGPLAAAGRCRPRAAPGAGARQGRHGSGWCRWIGRSSPSWPPICAQERPPGCATPECFVVLRGPTAGRPMTEAGLRRIFRTHRARAGTRGCARIGCATPTAPSSPRQGSTCSCCVS